jgi:hypothetical protein
MAVEVGAGSVGAAEDVLAMETAAWEAEGCWEVQMVGQLAALLEGEPEREMAEADEVTELLVGDMA